LSDDLVSVVIPTYDRRDLVADAIDSVLAQSHHGLDIVVVDDGSRDDTAEVVRRYGPRVRYVHQPNQGPSAARNLGIGMRRGGYVALLDSDDVWLPHKIEHDLAMFQADPSVDVIAGDVEYHLRGDLEHRSGFEAGGVSFDGRDSRSCGGDVLRLARGPVCSTSALVLTDDALTRLGPEVFDPSLRYDEDWDLEFRLFARFNVVLSRHIVCRCRQFDDPTRPFGLPDEPKSAADRLRLAKLRRSILRRYVDIERWEPDLRDALRRRTDELDVVLATVAPADTRECTRTAEH
jgi:glycosyltransferase involved in cell wall biosynthesis